MNRPSLYSIDIWASCEQSILHILSEALTILSNHTVESKNENEITVDLAKVIAMIRLHKPHATLADYGTVICQAQNQPLNPVDTAENIVSLQKEPDLLWTFYDENAGSPEKSQRYFTIECKCLSSSVHDKNYVVEGIKRFVLDDWGYGRYERSGAMIGYIKQHSAKYHLDSIHKQVFKQHYPTMKEVDSSSNSVSTCIQQFTEREFEPQSFMLYHLWRIVGQ